METTRQDCSEGQKWCRVHQRCEPIEDFYRDASQADGLMGFCKEEMLRRQKVRHANGTAQKSMRKYQKSAKGKWRNKARQAVITAVRRGQIVKPGHCEFGDALKYDGLHLPIGIVIEECLVTKISHHHYLGYKQEHWLKVIWLCDKHHALCEQYERS